MIQRPGSKTSACRGGPAEPAVPASSTRRAGCQAGVVLREFPLPPRASERLAQDGAPRQPAPPVRDAATVMLVRDVAGGVEVFAFRRVPRMAFAPGMLVFPGGSVDAADADAALPWDAPVDPATAPVLAAAVRETFEECGVLLAVPVGGRDAGLPPDAAELASPAWEERRTALAEGRSTLARVLTTTGLAAAGSALRPWARWVTPAF